MTTIQEIVALMGYHLGSLARDESDVFHQTFCLTISQTEARPLGAVVGIDPQVPRFMTTLASTSQNARADEGKTELSVYPLAMLAAAVAYQAGGKMRS